MTYVDGFVGAVPTENKEAFRKHCAGAAEVFMEYGALSHVECWGDDVPHGTLTDMHRAVQAKEGETIFFSWLVWPDKATRDAGMEKMMADPRMSLENNPMPFDGKRMIFGGFVPVLERHASKD